MQIADQVNAVTRRLATGEEGYIIALEQTFATTPKDLWDACTDPQRLARWFEPVEGDLREGGRYRLTDSGTEGTIEHCRAPAQLRISWEYGGDRSQVVVSIRPAGDRTKLTVEHAVPDDDHWKTHGPGAGGVGWDCGFLALALLLDGDARADPKALEAYYATPEGDEFLTATAEAWMHVHIALGGASSETARKASERTVEVYRGG